MKRRNEREGMIVHPYLSVALRTGSVEAFELAEQLSSWHDEMVVHTRALARGRAAALCHESCPHARAAELWRKARRILGETANRFLFLKAAATGSLSDGASTLEPRRDGDAVGLVSGELV